MTRALILSAHPCPESFSQALHAKVVERLSARGWDIDDCDLYEENFDPVLSRDERRCYHETATNRAPVAAHVARLTRAEALILVFPVWNFGFPAILKGYLDRVFLPGVSFRLENGRVRPNLTQVDKLVAVTTYGGTRWRAMMAGDPPRRCVCRAIWHVTRPRTMKYMALYDMNRAGEDRRARFLDRVGQTMDTL